MLTMYGIANCDTIKKAKKWLDAAGIQYTFHDYKKLGVDTTVLTQAIGLTSIEAVVNKRGTTFRKLNDEDKAVLLAPNNEKAAIALLSHNASVIKRPILHKRSSQNTDAFLIGFSDAGYQEFVHDA